MPDDRLKASRGHWNKAGRRIKHGEQPVGKAENGANLYLIDQTVTHEEARAINAELEARPKVTPLQRLIVLGKDAKFDDYKDVKSGRDKFSNMKLADMILLITEPLNTSIDDEAHLARVCRWVLRGLPVWQAIRKVEVEMEISELVKEREEWDKELYEKDDYE